MDPSLEKYLNDLRIQREEVEKRLKDREYKKRESDEIFVGSVKKELEWLEKNKIKYELRNKKFLEEAKDIVEGYKAELAKAYQADQALNASRRKLNKFIQKNYPKIVSELKSRLFRDHDEVSTKLKSIRDGGGEMLRLNKEIRDLSEEIQAKRYELLEEEERRLRNEGSLRHYQYVSNPYTKPYDAPSNYGKRNLSPQGDHEMSRSKPDIQVSPPRGGASGLNNHSHSNLSGDANRPSAISKSSNLKPSPDKDKLQASKGVSFGKISEVPHMKESDGHAQLRSSYGDGKGTSSLNIQQHAQPQQYAPPKKNVIGDEDYEGRGDLGKGKESGGFGFGKPAGGLSGFGGSQSQAPSAVGGLKVPAKETSPSPVKSGFGQPEKGGMQKLNLSNIGAPKQQVPVSKPVYNQQDMDDLEDFEDF